MENQIEALNQVSEAIVEYKALHNTLDFNETEKVLRLMVKLSTNLDLLEDYLTEVRDKYYTDIVKMLKNHSATEAEKRAKDLHPEKRMLERKIQSANKVFEAMKSHQSYLRNRNL